jgi:hypothetical protein
MKKHPWTAKLEAMGPGGAWTCLRIPLDVPALFKTRARVSVRGSINGFPFRTSIFPMGDGCFFMMVNKAMQKGAAVKAGDRVRVVLEKDDAPRTVSVPRDLQKALRDHPEAGAAFKAMCYSHRKEYVDWITGAKQRETRERRIQKAILMIAERKRAKA